MHRNEIHYLTDISYRLLSPKNALTGAALGTGTGEVRVFDTSKEGILLAGVGNGIALAPVSSFGEWVVGDTVQIDKNNGTRHLSVVSSLTPATSSLGLTTPMSGTALVNAQVQCSLQTPVALALYGTPSTYLSKWGYTATLLGTAAWRKPGMVVRVELAFFGQGGGGLDHYESETLILVA